MDTRSPPVRPRLAETFRARSFRVVLLLAVIAAMSAIDLYLTILYLTHTGMPEANPLARALISYQSPLVLAAWKFLTVAVFAGILYLVRHRRSAEMGAWVGAVVLTGLMSHWVRFIDHAAVQHAEYVVVGAQIDRHWVSFDTDLIGP